MSQGTGHSSLVPLRSETGFLFVLTAIQFTHTLDFVIMMPLGPQIMRAFDIGPSEFGLMVSAYTWSAAVSGLIGAFFLDRLDRKRALLVLYAGFIFGTWLCAIAPTHVLFIAARAVAGAFGGVMTAVTLSMISEAIPPQRQGAATGTVMSAFALASILGIPIGLFVAQHRGWHAAFYFLVVVSAVVYVMGLRVLPSFRVHMEGPRESLWKSMSSVFQVANHGWSFLLVTVMMFSTFTVVPYIGAYFTANAGLPESQLFLIYFVGGFFTLFTARLVGRLSDLYGRKKIFYFVLPISIAPTLWVTHLPHSSLGIILFASSFMMMAFSGRMIVSMALMQTSADPHHRGGFMSVLGSVQQLSAGIASFVAGNLISKSPEGLFVGYPYVGYLAATATLIGMVVATRLSLPAQNRLANATT